MGKVACIAVPGLDLWFNSSDHDPPHFHARKPGEWEIRVYFLTTTSAELDYDEKFVLKGNGPSKQVRRTLIDLVLGHRGELYAEWDAKVCQ